VYILYNILPYVRVRSCISGFGEPLFIRFLSAFYPLFAVLGHFLFFVRSCYVRVCFTY